MASIVVGLLLLAVSLASGALAAERTGALADPASPLPPDAGETCDGDARNAQQNAAPTLVEEDLRDAPGDTAVADCDAQPGRVGWWSERIESDVPIDLLDSKRMSRAGDSNAAAALRRVPGLTVARGKFVYVRGLGERYSSASLNGATVPSPDLSRNVVPLDLFPSAVLDAISVQKGFSPEMPAAFGGGNVDMRTKQIPEDPVFSVKVKTGWTSDSGYEGLSYRGGGDDRMGQDDGTRALSGRLREAIRTYRGDFSEANIHNTLRLAGGSPTLADAQAINRQLATALNRDVDIRPQDLSPDMKAQVTGGYRWLFGEHWELGFLAVGVYENDWRNKDRIKRSVTRPETDFVRRQRTVESVSVTGTANLGLRFTDDHEIGTTSLILRDTGDDASFSLSCGHGQSNDCADDSPTQGRTGHIRFEERELIVNQIRGRHALGDDTLGIFPALEKFSLLRDTTVSWYYSEARATTDIPNEVRVKSLDVLDGPYGNVVGTSLRSSGAAGDFRFSDLDDDVESWGSDVTFPMRAGTWDIELSGGFDHARKTRFYQQVSLGIGGAGPGFGDISGGTPSEVFSDANLMDPNNGFTTLLGFGGFGLESYYAEQVTEAAYGKFDILIDDAWRISGGARREDFMQVSVPVDVSPFGGRRVPPREISGARIDAAGTYPSLALTYIRPEFWADHFQLRFSWSDTVVRPDIREVSRSSYLDPLTDARVHGNPFLAPTALANFDVRAEWFWDSGDHVTVSAFHKDLTDPIETLQGPATGDDGLFNFVNADAAEINGAELEGLKSLGFLRGWVGDWVGQFYVAGNVTLSDSRLHMHADGLSGNITNTSRRMTQHSEWVVNLQMGFDSYDGRHGATLVYNSFGERIFFGGIDSFDDAYEQPFHALDFVYTWSATERISVKLRVKNLLGESVELEQGGVTILEQDVATSALLDVKWTL